MPLFNCDLLSISTIVDSQPARRTGLLKFSGALFLALLAPSLFSQPETNVWHFGAGNKYTFSTGLVGPSSINTQEGCASVCDASGNTLFYTDGQTVWNRNDAIMMNGTGLMSGGNSSTQAALIVPNPGNSTLYYVFVAAQEALLPGITYSEVDITQDGGNGAVTATKNVQLTPFAMSEKLTAVRHCNGIDMWVIAKRYGDNGFRSFLVTASGVDPVPVISSSGYSPSGSVAAAYGQMKANNTGTKIAAAYYGTAGGGGNRVELYDFDPATGIVSNAVNIGAFTGAYGVEFSQDGNYLYASSNAGILRQYNVCTGAYTQIVNTGLYIGSLQTGNDGRIYASRGPTNRFLAAIHNPNNPGLSCNFEDAFLSFTGFVRFGLPNNLPFYFRPPQPFFTINKTGCNQIEATAYFNSNCTETPVITWNTPTGTQYGNPITTVPGLIELNIEYRCESFRLVDIVSSSLITATIVLN